MGDRFGRSRAPRIGFFLKVRAGGIEPYSEARAPMLQLLFERPCLLAVGPSLAALRTTSIGSGPEVAPKASQPMFAGFGQSWVGLGQSWAASNRPSWYGVDQAWAVTINRAIGWGTLGQIRAWSNFCPWGTQTAR